MTPDIVGRHTQASEAGIIVAVGPGAFKWNSNGINQFEGHIPQPGDRVFVERYAGQILYGADKEVYRMIDDTSIGAVASQKEETE